MNNPIKDKWEKHYNSCTNDLPLPAAVLLHKQHLLPAHGTALDLACGHGANALCLAAHGLTVFAWDIAAAALTRLAQTAKERAISIKTEARDVTQYPPAPDTFDVIVVSRFLERDLIESIRHAIKSNGLIFYQTFIKDKVADTGPRNPNYLLGKNELLQFFSDWNIIYYCEEGTTGNLEQGFRNQAMIIAQKP